MIDFFTRVAIPARPELRKPRREATARYRIRVNLDDSDPVIWRELLVRSDLTLEALHQVLQAAFDWQDYHLYRFALGGDPFDFTSQVFACSQDIDSADTDCGDIPVDGVRLDELLADVGDIAAYAYDYGDHWGLTLRLHEVLLADADAPAAVCTDGRRAAPPEDCGSRRTAEDLADVLDDPAAFDVADVSQRLTDPFHSLATLGIDPHLVVLATSLRFSPIGPDLIGSLVELAHASHTPTDDEMRAALRAHQWFLDRAGDDGIPLTSAGYLKPADVREVAPLVPMMGTWPRPATTESQTPPLLRFRESLQGLGLLRKNRDRLVATKAGIKARNDVRALWRHLAQRLSPRWGNEFEDVATPLYLVFAATAPGADVPTDALAQAMTELGWRFEPDPVPAYAIGHLLAAEVLANVGTESVHWSMRNRVSPVAAALARAALNT